MERKCKLLSLCIPTNGAVHFVLPVLDSIYSQGVDDSFFEVVITDNGNNSLLGNSLALYAKHGNLKYYKSDLPGFVNQVDAFKRSNGLFIKMLNHRAKLLPGKLTELINLVNTYKEIQPNIYCSNGALNIYDITYYSNLDSFIRNLSYYCSWSAGVGIWAKDKPRLDEINYNTMFPHASIMFETGIEKDYVIWNKKFVHMEEDPRKGGYNLFQTFAVYFLDLLKEQKERNRIKDATFNFVKKDLKNFLSVWYSLLIVRSTEYTFSTENYKKYILVYYSRWDLYYIKVRGLLLGLLNELKSYIKCFKLNKYSK